MNLAETALFSDTYLDKEKGYKKYFDIESIVEWYIINEITENSTSRGNWYMNLKRGEKIKMGPLWDFDMAFCNSQWSVPPMDPYVFYVREVEWINQMWKDPEFLRLIKDRFYYYYDKREQIYEYIDSSAHYLKYAAEENENKWNTFYVNVQPSSPKELNIWGNYYSEVQYMKEWLNVRFEWLKSEIDKI